MQIIILQKINYCHLNTEIILKNTGTKKQWRLRVFYIMLV